MDDSTLKTAADINTNGKEIVNTLMACYIFLV